MLVDASLLESALNSMRDLVLIKGPRSQLIWANTAFLDYYGMTPEDLRDIVDGPQSDPDDTLQYVRDDALVFELETHVDVPVESVTDHRGDQRAFHTIKSPIVIDGSVAMSVGVSRRHDDSQVTVSPSHVEAKTLSKPLRLLTSAFPLAAAIVDVRGRIVTASPVWQDWFGAAAGGADTFFADGYPQLATIAPDVSSAMRGVESPVRRVGLQTRRGPSDHEFRLGPWRYDDGTIGGVLILALDVTDEAAQTNRLREANERFDLVLGGASVGIWDWMDVARDAQYWSPRFYHLLGYRPGEIEPSRSSFGELLHPDDQERTGALIVQHIESGEPFDIDYRLRSQSGALRWFRGSGLAARADSGGPTRMAGSIQDIDARIRSQQAIERMNEDLEHFAHVAAHDLREPVRRQRMLIDLTIEDHGDDIAPELRRDLESIREQSENMLNMIAGFRSLTGFSGPALQLESFDLQAMAERIVGELLPDDQAGDAAIDLPGALSGYPVLVDILLRNLVQNAARHGSHPLQLTFATRQQDAKTIVVVENSWSGDPDGFSDRFFQPFVAGRDRETSGLGLSICRRVVDHHRGWIRAEPRPGTFRIEISLGNT